MASSANSDLGADLEKMAKIFNACKQIQNIESEIARATENLKNVETDCDKINVYLPSLQDFHYKIKECIESSESLRAHMKSINQSHANCLAALQEMAETSEINENQLKKIITSLESIIADCEKFGSDLSNFERNLRELQKISERVSGEALREEEKVRKEAASTRSEARWTSVGQWTKRIFTLGLITLSSDFQQDVKDNNERYRNADELYKLSKKFHEARMSLDMAAKTVGEILERMGGGSIKLTKELVDIIKQVLSFYKSQSAMKEEIANLKQKDHVKDEEIANLKQKDHDKDEEIANLKQKDQDKNEVIARLMRELEETKRKN